MSTATASTAPDPAALDGARPGELPERLLPQLPTPTDLVPAGAGWLHEIKHDGYRMTITLRSGAACLWTRNGYNWTPRLPELAAALAALGLTAALDAELVCLDTEGKTDFSLLQSCVAAGRGRPLLYLFDLVHLDGWDLARVPLEIRKELLRQILADRTDPATSPLRYSDHIIGNGPQVFSHACRHGLEGIISKRAESRYHPGKRSTDWLKCKNPQHPAMLRVLAGPWARRKG